MNIYKASKPIHLIFHPISLLSFWAGKKDRLHEIILLKSAKIIWKDSFIIDRFKAALNELNENNLIQPNENPELKNKAGNSLRTTFGKWIYCTVRAIQPEIMVETGVSHGASSWIILNAMKKNGKGHLYSIDLPNLDTNQHYNFIAGPIETGWMVPSSLRTQWSLILGDAKKELPELLDKLKKVDIFFHDSDHSYEHMKFEFETMSQSLRKEGILLSDDIDKNTSFQEFIGSNKWKAVEFNKGGCAIRSN